MHIGRVEVGRTLVSVQCIGGLVVARLVLGRVSHAQQQHCHSTYQSSQVVPNLGNVWIQANGTRVGVESVTVLIDLVIEHTNGAPKGRVASITVHGLLVGFVSLWILLLRHVAATQKVPALRIAVVCAGSAGFG